MVLGKSGKSDLLWLKLIVVVAVLYMFVPQVQTRVNGLFGAAPGPTTALPTETSTKTIGDICQYDGTVMTIGPAQKKYVVTTAVTTEHHRIYVNGVDKGLKIDGTTMDVSYKDKVTVVYAENSSTYYAAKQDFVVPCVKTFSTADDALDGDKFLLLDEIANTSITITFFNDDETVNTLTNNQTIGASDQVVMRGKFKYAAKSGWSPYGKTYLSFKYNNTAYDEIIVSAVTSGMTVTEADTPNVRETTTPAASGYSWKTYTIPGVDAKDAVTQEILINIDSDDTANPTGLEGHIEVYMDDEDYYQLSTSPSEEFGVETDLDGDVGCTDDVIETIALS